MSNQGNRNEASKAGINITLDTVEKFVFDGFQKRFTEVFEAKSIWATSSDKTKLLQKLFGNMASGAAETQVQYPYAFFTLNTATASDVRGNLKVMSLHGLSAVLMVDDQKRAFRVKLTPTDFSVTVEFVTNNYQQVLAYVNKWMFARTNGWLRYNVQYGNAVFTIAADLDGTVQMPQREADLTNVQEYVVTTTVTIQGFMSFATLMEQQVVDTVVVSTLVGSSATDASSADLLSQTTWEF